MMRYLFAIAATLVPAIAQACPACANREGQGIGTLVVLGIMILFPFVVAVVVYPVIRSLNGRADLKNASVSPKDNLG
jgi:hypothetical protein